MDMRIANAYNTYSVYNAKNTPGVKKADYAGKTDGSKDTFTLSMKAEDYQVVRRALASTPDIRSEKVNQLKAKIEAGTYNVSAEDIAAKIIGVSD